MIDTTVDAKLVERRMPRAGTSGVAGLSLGEITAGILTGLVFVLIALTRTEVTTIAACVVGLVLDAGLFLVSLNGAHERAIHLIPRYWRFARSYAHGSVDAHTRAVEGRHYTNRAQPDDVPLSPHLGLLWLSSFDWGTRPVGLLIEGGSRWRPWRAAHMIVVQVAGKDQLLLESADYQETLTRRWNGFLNTLSKRSLGLTAAQELLVSRPVIQGEGAHWQGFERLLAHQPIEELRDEYRAMQLDHDATDIDRRIYLVLRSGGTFGAWFKARHRGSSRAGVEAHFSGILDKLGNMAREAKLTVVGVLSADQLAAELRLMVDPASAPAVGYRRGGDRAVRSAPVQVAPIMDWEKHRSSLIVNGMHVATYRTIGWPDAVLGSSLLAAALLEHKTILRVGIPITPENPKVARRTNKAAQTNAQAKADRKAATGTVVTEDERMADSVHAQRDMEMAHKHHSVVLTAYYTLIAPDADSLRRAADDLATQLDTAGVDVQNCYAHQEEAYGYTLPFGHGT